MHRDAIDAGNLSLLHMMGNPFDEEHTYTLMDLPRETLVKVVEQTCITLEDRMELRRTCREMREVVGRSDYIGESLGFSKERSYNGGLIISGLLKHKRRIPVTFQLSYINLMRKLFRQARFDRMSVNFFNFDEHGSFGLDVLVELAKAIVCNSLTIFIDAHFQPWMLEFLDHIEVQALLQLHIHRIRDEFPSYLLRIPPMKVVRISSDAAYELTNRSPSYVPDQTLLALIEKHGRISLTRTSHLLTKKRIIEARKLIAECRHSLEVDLPYYIVEMVHDAIGVEWDGHCLRSNDANVQITATINGSRRRYVLNVDRTNVSFGFKYVSEETFDETQTVTLLIEPCDD